MDSSRRREIIKLMRQDGFRPYREVKHGTFWVKDKHYVLIARPTRTDDPRASRNAINTIRKARST